MPQFSVLKKEDENRRCGWPLWLPHFRTLQRSRYALKGESGPLTLCPPEYRSFRSSFLLLLTAADAARWKRGKLEDKMLRVERAHFSRLIESRGPLLLARAGLGWQAGRDPRRTPRSRLDRDAPKPTVLLLLLPFYPEDAVVSSHTYTRARCCHALTC